MNARHREILTAMLSLPTAPFHEQALAGWVLGWARRTGLEAATDRHGNILLRRPGRRRGKALRWVFAAHMDHPGFVAGPTRRGVLAARFMGHVGAEYFGGARVRFFAGDGEVVAKVTSVRPSREHPFLDCRLSLSPGTTVPPGAVGMWDFPAVKTRGGRLWARSCDDVAGAAALLCALADLPERSAADVTVLLTRAEEAGFVGALAACQDRTLPADALLVAVECSKAQPAARLGQGVVVRVGDRIRTFEPTLTAHLSAVAESLARQDKAFRFVRQLMPGGVCESTVYAAWGYRAGALSLPLGNYHNQGPGRRVAAEQIDLGDFECLVTLLVALAGDGSDPAATDRRLRSRLQGLLAERKKFLADGAAARRRGEARR